MAPHDHRHIDAGQRPVVGIHPGEGQGHETGRRGIAGRVVVDRQVVVDGLGDVDAAHRIVVLLGLLADDAQGVRRIVAADVEEGLDAVSLQDLENLLAVLEVGLVAGRTQRRARRLGHQFQVVGGFLGEVEELLVDDAAHAVVGAIDPFHRRELARFNDRADHRLVDHGRRATACATRTFPFSMCSTLPQAR